MIQIFSSSKATETGEKQQQQKNHKTKTKNPTYTSGILFKEQICGTITKCKQSFSCEARRKLPSDEEKSAAHLDSRIYEPCQNN